MLPGSKRSKANADECLGRAVTLGSRSDAICSPLSSAFDREPSADSYLCLHHRKVDCAGLQSLEAIADICPDGLSDGAMCLADAGRKLISLKLEIKAGSGWPYDSPTTPALTVGIAQFW